MLFQIQVPEPGIQTAKTYELQTTAVACSAAVCGQAAERSRSGLRSDMYWSLLVESPPYCHCHPCWGSRTDGLPHGCTLPSLCIQHVMLSKSQPPSQLGDND